MTKITLGSCEPRTLLSHMALYGLGAILASEGVRDVQLSWTASANPRPVVSMPEIDEITMATLVRQHAESRKADGSWVQQNLPTDAKPRGLMSPRLSQFGGRSDWAQVQSARHTVLDTLTAHHHWLDLRFLAALGEPCYWSANQKGEPLQDNGASRFEMQPRNQGSEFVGSRLRKVAATVSLRNPDGILAGLRGDSVADEAGNDKGVALLQ